MLSAKINDIPRPTVERNIADRLIDSPSGIPYKSPVDLTDKSLQVPFDENPIPFGRTLDETKPLPTIKPLSVTSNTPKAGLDKMETGNRIIDDTIPEAKTSEIGKIGTAIKSIAPTIFSAIDGFTTKGNVNVYQDYGREGLETLDTAKRDINISLNQNTNDINNAVAGSKQVNNQSARSLNVARALNLSTDLAGQESQNKLASQYADKRIDLNSVIANAQNQRDSVVMKGADEKQVRDQEDRSKIISNFSGAAQAIGSGAEHIGKMVNDGMYNEDTLSIINAMFPNVTFSLDAKGKLKASKNNG